MEFEERGMTEELGLKCIGMKLDETESFELEG
jgi:hypothetical protein